MSPPRKLKVDLGTLAESMQGMGGEEVQEYLDLRTGELHLLDGALLGAVEDEDTETLPDWQRDMIPIAEAVLAGDENLVEVPRLESRDSFEVMRDFIGQLKDPAARDRLNEAIAGRKPFRQFKDALEAFPAIREKWFAFEAEEYERLAREWLEEIGVEPIDAGRE